MDFVIEKVDGRNVWYGGQNFEVLYRVGRVGDPDEYWSYFDDVEDAYRLLKKIKGGSK